MRSTERSRGRGHGAHPGGGRDGPRPGDGRNTGFPDIACRLGVPGGGSADVRKTAGGTPGTRGQTVIRRDGFVGRLRRAGGSGSARVAVRRGWGQRAKLGVWCARRDVVLAAAGVCRTASRDLLVRWSRGDTPRQILLYMAAEPCRGRDTLSGLARRPGGIPVSGLAGAHGRIAVRLKTERDAASHRAGGPGGGEARVRRVGVRRVPSRHGGVPPATGHAREASPSAAARVGRGPGRLRVRRHRRRRCWRPARG